MILSAIVAIDRAGLIGANGGIPWHLPADLRRFRRLTIGKPIIMGRRTFESLVQPLPDRANIVVSRQANYRPGGCHMADSVEGALDVARRHLATCGGNEAVVIGGADLYRATASQWDRLYLTVVAGEYHGDTVFPLDALAGRSYQVGEQTFHPPDERNRDAHWYFRLDFEATGSTSGTLDPSALIAAQTDQPPITR